MADDKMMFQDLIQFFLYDHFYRAPEPEPRAQEPIIYLAVPLFDFG